MTSGSRPGDRLTGLIEAGLSANPAWPALDGHEGCLSHGQLDARSAAVAARLHREGVGPADVVIVQGGRGLQLIIAVLGVVRAGAAFCVVDPSHPAARIAQLWRRSGAVAALLTDGQPAPRDVGAVRVVSLVKDCVTEPATVPPRSPTDADPAYVVFTSGSTGGPKAVSMPRRAVENLVRWTLANTSDEPLRTLSFAPLGFDVFVQELLTALCSGGCLTLMPEADRPDLPRVLELLRQERIQRLFVSPAVLVRLAELAGSFERFPDSLREVAAAGEALHITPAVRELFRRIPGCRLHNHYGPAETHVVAAYTCPGDPADWPARPPIGAPITGTVLELRTDDGQLLPDSATGVEAELCVSGVALADGYLGAAELSAQRFAVLPTSRGDVRCYLTGDRVLRDPAGQLHFLGRRDHQLKVRGYRVDPLETESALLRHPQVRECAVVGWQRGDGETQLVAHVVAASPIALAEPELRAFLADLLPTYLQPGFIIFTERLPLSANGKLDRAALPEPAAGAVSDGASPLDRAVAEIWSDLLGLPSIPPDRRFIELGGTSLSAARLITRLHARFDVQLTLAELSDTSTVSQLSRLLRRRMAS